MKPEVEFYVDSWKEFIYDCIWAGLLCALESLSAVALGAGVYSIYTEAPLFFWFMVWCFVVGIAYTVGSCIYTKRYYERLKRRGARYW